MDDQVWLRSLGLAAALSLATMSSRSASVASLGLKMINVGFFGLGNDFAIGVFRAAFPGTRLGRRQK